jgi:hypothetical protein
MARDKRSVLVGGLLAWAIAGVAPAHADGGPVLGAVAAGNHAIAIPGGAMYAARPVGRDTVVRSVAAGGRGATAKIPGRYGVPVVAFDGATSGLSADGRTLVLVRPRIRFPARSSRLVVLAARTLRVERHVRLRGDFGFDAISPDGRWIYLIQYTTVDPNSYRVRALDTRTGRMLRRPIVDPRDTGDAMRGSPIARATSADGRWAYTLYDGAGHPFVHALDTAGLRARCIDLPAFRSQSNWFDARIGSAAGGQRLLVTLHGRTLAALDTTTFKVTDLDRATRGGPVAAKPAATRPAATRAGGGMIGIGFPAALAALLLGGGIVALRRRRIGSSST